MVGSGVLAYYAGVEMLEKAKQHQRDLFESERSFRLLVDAVTDYALYMLDPNGVVTTAKPTAPMASRSAH
jgi:hypothetical protein